MTNDLKFIEQVYSFFIYEKGPNHYVIMKYDRVVDEYIGSLAQCKNHIYDSLI